MNTVRKETTTSGLVLEYSPVTVDGILTPADAARNGVQTDRHRVQLRQEVKITYPAARGNDLFSAEEFGVGPGQSFVEKRVTWLNVPKTATKEQIEKILSQMDSPKLVRTLSLKPVLSDDQLRTIENGRNPKSFEDYLEDFVKDINGAPVLYHGQKQYRKITFSKSFAEDNDNRAIDFQEMSKAKSFQISATPKEAGVKATI